MVPTRLQPFKRNKQIIPIDQNENSYVVLQDILGSESSIVRAARTSYGAGTKKRRSDTQLIRYLMRHKHTGPFEFCEIVLHIQAPMDVWRQWVRHRTASINEYSTRYSEAIDAMSETPLGKWRVQSTSNKQGSGGLLPPEFQERLSTGERELHEAIRKEYEYRLSVGVSREQARKDLPLSNYTCAEWKIDLHNLLHFLKLRMDSHAQYEIRMFANAIAEIVKVWVPNVWKAFEDYSLNAMTLSAQQVEFVSMLLQNWRTRDVQWSDEELVTFLTEFKEGCSKREARELLNALSGAA